MKVRAGLVHWPFVSSVCAGVALASAVPMSAITRAQTVTSISEIGPKRSNSENPNAASGGRVNKLAIGKTDSRLMLAASEWGGLFKSEDAGRTWRHLPGHTPHATWSVKIDPTEPQRVYATSFYDGRIESRAGINVSTNGGETWTRPTTATPPADFCVGPFRRTEPSAFGIAIDPANPDNVYVGTNCGLAVSNDRGETWSFIDPTPSDGADSIWDVVVHHGGIIDVCGDDGHRRLVPGATEWTTATTAALLPSGICSLAVSPDEPNVLFLVIGTTIYESDDGGATWRRQPYTNPEQYPQGRIPFVAVNDRGGTAYDLWYGDISLFRRSCTTPAAPVPAGTPRCNPATLWVGGFTRTAGGHDDVGDILFDSAATVDACPVLFSSDGGVYYNTLATSPDCHSPRWSQPDVTPQAVWNYVMVGVNIPGAGAEDLYVGNQDTGAFGTRRGSSSVPAWHVERCCDIFDVAADTETVVFTSCCSRDDAGNFFATLHSARPGLTGSTAVTLPPAASVQKFNKLSSLVNLGSGAYALVAPYLRFTPRPPPLMPGDPPFVSDFAWGVFVSNDISAGRWTQLGDTTTPRLACGVQAASAAGTVSLFVKSGGCDGDRPGPLWRYDGLAAGSTWRQVPPHPAGGFGVYAVDPNDPDRILASVLPAGPPQMVRTARGGASWESLPQLDSLMTGHGVFVYRTGLRGARDWTTFGRYPQPTMVAISPRDGRIVAAGAADSGVFVNFSGGSDGAWRRVTDPDNPRTSGIPHIPRPRSAHFEHVGFGLILYIGSQGRGQWRITLEDPPAAGRIERDGEHVSVHCPFGPCDAHYLMTLPCEVISVDTPFRGCRCEGGPTALCPPLYNIVLEGIPLGWDAALLDKNGRHVERHRLRVGERMVLSMQPSKEEYNPGGTASYLLLLRTSSVGKVASSFKFRSTVHLSSMPLDRHKLRALLDSKRPEGPGNR